jgi:hypothetical protein
MELTDQQATSILVEGLQRGLFEPAVPAEEADRLLDATKLVEACESAYKTGNRSDNVTTILFMAQVNSDTTDNKVTTDIAPIPEQIKGQISIPVQEDHMHNGLNLAELSDGILDQLIVGLDKYPQTDEVEIDRKAYTAEKERRGNGSGKELEKDSSAQVPPEAEETSGESAEQTTGSDLQEGNQTSGESGEQNGATDPGTEIHAQQDSGQEEDASAFARAQTPETSGKGKPAKAKAQEKDGERAELEGKLNYAMVKAHNTDLISLSKAPINELRYIVENPSGPVSTDSEEIAPKEEDKVAILESDVVGVTNPKLDNALGGIVPVKSVEQKVVTKADLNLNIEEDQEENRGGISPERETLETLITGPILKAYGRGRKEVPDIGDNELRLMVLNPTGQISPEELQKAQMMDGKSILVEPDPGKTVVNAMPTPEQEDKAHEFVEAELAKDNIILEGPQDRSLAKAATESVNKPEELSDPITKSEQARFAPGDNPTTDTTLPSGQIVKVLTKSPDKLPTVVDIDDNEIDVAKPLTGQARAMEIIEKENFPIPPNLSEQAPILPFDVSKCSRDELFSLHAMFHACESRINWVLTSFEDELGDIEKLRRVREIDVADSVPLISTEDGKRITNEFRDAKVAADTLVIQYYEEEHEKKKTVNRLKVLQRNYLKDCERLSRQMSKYEREKNDAPR